MTEVKHTPLVVGGHSGKMVFDNLGTQIANCGTQEEAHMFVKCVNMHDELVRQNEIMQEALETVADYDTGSTAGLAFTAKEALKKAGAL